MHTMIIRQKDPFRIDEFDKFRQEGYVYVVERVERSRAPRSRKAAQEKEEAKVGGLGDPGLCGTGVLQGQKAHLTLTL